MNNKQRLKSYLKSNYKILIFALIFAFIFVVSQIGQPFLLGKALDKAKDDAKTSFYFYTLFALTLIILGSVFAYFFELIVNHVVQDIIKKMRDDVFKKINDISIDDIYQKRQGDIVLLQIRDMENIASGLYAVCKTLMQGIFTVIITIFMMIFANWILGLIVILLTPLSVLMARIIARYSHKYYKKQSQLQAGLSDICLETLNNIEIVQSLNHEAVSIALFNKKNEQLRKEGKFAQFTSSWVNPSMRFVNNIIYVIVGTIGVIMLSYDTSLALVFAVMSIGRLSSFLSFTNQYSKPFNEISSVNSEYQNAKASFTRINDFLNLNNDIDEGKMIIKDIDSIVFKDVSFAYTPSQRLFDHFSFEIKKGYKVAIVGPTGAGKTSLINLLMRFYDPISGCIEVNNTPLPLISKKSLRSHIGMVLQDTWIFSGTIRENIAYLNSEASEEDIVKAAEKSHADVFINCLPKGYDTYIDNKQGLSEGQKQMIAIARVMLMNPKMVILDEATSNIDTRSEKLITDAFDQMMKEKTSIVIAHRLSTIEKADTIIVMDKGAIIETGNHLQLMERKGFYYRLYISQYK